MAIVKPTITMELTIEEAQALTDVLASVGGNPLASRRRHTDAVYEALTDAGFRHWASFAGIRDFTGSVSFKEEV